MKVEELLHIFAEEREAIYKGERYLVRDNGAVYRHSSVPSKRRKLDEVWTFGALNRSTGYLVVRDHVVHQIMATAFHGPKPSNDHVVDHIDTNRQNNRADNLRWVTRLENVLLNPITRRRIEIAFGSIEAFFENPQSASIPNWDWMRTVSPEQAQESRKRLLEWAASEQSPKGGAIGDWLFESDRKASSVTPEPIDTPSLTSTAFQRGWRTPTEFPQCPDVVGTSTINEYIQRLDIGAVFSRNQYGEGVLVHLGLAPNNVLIVLSTMASEIKNYALAKIYLENGAVCHESVRTFFTLPGALKVLCQITGEPFHETIDDGS